MRRADPSRHLVLVGTGATVPMSRGFTLVEIMAALTVGAIAIVGMHVVLGALTDQADRVTAVAADLDRVANGERILRTLAGRLDVGTSPEDFFGGDEQRTAFTSWCDTPSGWSERCHVTLTVTPTDSTGLGHVLAAVLSTGEAIPLLSGSSRIELRYLGEARNGGRWFRRWGAGVAPPVAIGVIMHADTLIVRIGDRG